MELANAVREEITNKDIRVSILGHMQRGGSPTYADRTLASRLGLAAVEGLIDGKSNEMVGVINDKIEYTPLKEAITRDKPLNPDLIRAMKILSL